MGPVALHGGGEFLPGDERFLLALLDAAVETAEPIRVVLLPTAAAGHDPDAATRLGTSAFEAVAGLAGRPVRIDVARVVDPGSAEDADITARIAAADLVYLPGGDPSIIPRLLPGTAAWRAVATAQSRGAVLAGASAGAMALASFAWTPAGIVAGLGVVPGLVVFPHADEAAWARQTEWFPTAAAAGLGILGIGEQTGLISARSTGQGPGGPWRIVGTHEVRWLAPGAAGPVVLVDGQTLTLPG